MSKIVRASNLVKSYRSGTDELRIVRIADTSSLARLIVSEAVLEELKARDDIRVLGEVSWQFDADGNLA